MSFRPNPNSTYQVKFKNGTGPVNARWNVDKEVWIIYHPLAGRVEVKMHAVTVVGVVIGTEGIQT